LQGKVNDNVRTIPQSLNNEQVVQAQINVKLRDDRDNIFYDPKDLNEAISADGVKPRNSVFGAGCKTNYFAYESWNNYFGDKCIGNSFGYGCHGNRLGYDCSKNTFESYCKGNKLGSYCKFNTIGNSCNNNTLGNNCGYITLGKSCSNNIFGNKSNQITLDYRCVHNTFENECTNISLGSDCANIHIINSRGISFSKPALRNITVLNINGGGLEITIPDEYLVEQRSSRHLIITSKATGESTADDLIFYFADEVATQENVDSQISAKTVRYDKEQSLTDNQKQQARKNIGAGKPVESGTDISVENNKANIAITENITVAGLSDTYGCGLIKNGDTIPKGTSLSKILEMMLTKELMPATATKPTISITKTSVVSGLHEIGETVNVGTATISKTAGHFNNNGWASPAQPTAKFTWSGETMTSQLASGATGYVKQTGASIAQGTAKTAKGTNKVSITASANYSAPTNSPITNLGNTKTDAAYTWTASKASATSTIEWTGVYPCFTNLGKLGTEPTVKLTLQTGATFSISVPSHNAGNNDFRFAYPDGWTISSFKVKSLDGKYYEFAADHNKNAGNLTKTIQGVSVTYHYLTVANGASDYQITLNKALNA